MSEHGAGRARPRTRAAATSSAHFRQGAREITVLRGADCRALPGEMVALVGPSGAGKSTLLHIAGLLETPDGGEVDHRRPRLRAAGRRRAHARAPRRDRLRLPVPPPAAGVLGARERRHAADDPRRCHAARPTSARRELLRYARPRRARSTTGRPSCPAASSSASPIARAVANAPRLLLADEPTGNLDPRTSAHVFDELLELIARHRRRGPDRHPQSRARQAHGPRLAAGGPACSRSRRRQTWPRADLPIAASWRQVRGATRKRPSFGRSLCFAGCWPWRFSLRAFFALAGPNRSLHGPPLTLCPLSERHRRLLLVEQRPQKTRLVEVP